jgi:hypothetical protein
MFYVIDHQLFHNATMMHYISWQNQSAASHMTRETRFQKRELNLDGGSSTELSIAKDDSAQMRTGASYEEQVHHMKNMSCNEDNMHKVQTLK